MIRRLRLKLNESLIAGNSNSEQLTHCKVGFQELHKDIKNVKYGENLYGLYEQCKKEEEIQDKSGFNRVCGQLYALNKAYNILGFKWQDDEVLAKSNEKDQEWLSTLVKNKRFL